MRPMINGAVLMVPEHEAWMRAFIADCESLRPRIALRPVALSPRGKDAVGADGLRLAVEALARFDLCVLPVAQATLGWTRLALASASGALPCPVLGVAHEIKAVALQDLLALGVADFLRTPVCAEEFKIRAAQLASGARVSRPGASGQDDGRGEGDRMRQLLHGADGEPFQAAKARIVTAFERDYIAGMLWQTGGNISQAARCAQKNRRAFFQLMRKHDIAAAPYRGAVLRSSG